MISEIRTPRKPEHPAEDFAPQIPCHELKLVVRMYYRTCMETKIGDPDCRHVIVESVGK
jgi:hypothetical protein